MLYICDNWTKARGIVNDRQRNELEMTPYLPGKAFFASFTRSPRQHAPYFNYFCA